MLSATERGLKTLSDVTHDRQKLRHPKYKDAVDRLSEALKHESKSQLVWHKSSYTMYTNRTKLNKLKETSLAESSPSCSSAPRTETPSSWDCHRRSSLKPINWELCMFCQEDKSKQKLTSVTTLNKSTEILEASRFEPKMRVRVAGVSDLIAAEGKYHLSCYVQFTRKISQTKQDTQHTELPMIWLCDELKYSADHGHVLELTEVWHRYCTIAKESNVEILVSFTSRMKTFADKLADKICDFYEILVLRDNEVSERRSVLVPLKFAHIPISSTKTLLMGKISSMPHNLLLGREDHLLAVS